MRYPQAGNQSFEIGRGNREVEIVRGCFRRRVERVTMRKRGGDQKYVPRADLFDLFVVVVYDRALYLYMKLEKGVIMKLRIRFAVQVQKKFLFG